jgi:hypothetical protein
MLGVGGNSKKTVWETVQTIGDNASQRIQTIIERVLCCVGYFPDNIPAPAVREEEVEEEEVEVLRALTPQRFADGASIQYTDEERESVVPEDPKYVDASVQTDNGSSQPSCVPQLPLTDIVHRADRSSGRTSYRSGSSSLTTPPTSVRRPTEVTELSTSVRNPLPISPETIDPNDHTLDKQRDLEAAGARALLERNASRLEEEVEVARPILIESPESPAPLSTPPLPLALTRRTDVAGITKRSAAEHVARILKARTGPKKGNRK